MRESFENKFKNKIKQTFDNHEPKFNPALWQDMKQKLGEKKTKKVVVISLLRKTAAVWILLLVFTGVILSKFIFEKNQTKEISIKSQIQEQKQELRKSDKDKPKTQKSNTLRKDFSIENKKNNEQFLQKNEKFEKKNVFIQKSNTPQKNTTTFFPSKNIKHLKKWQVKAKNIISRNQSIPNKTNVNLSIDKLNSIYTLAQIPNSQKNNSLIDEKNILHVGLAFNTSQNTNLNSGMYQQSTGFGLGVISDIPIYHKWSLQTGIAVNQQNWENQNNDEATSILYSNSNAPVSLNEILRASNRNQENSLNLMILDFPLQIQHPILENKKMKVLASAGLSSYWYVQEKIVSSKISATTTTIFDESLGQFTNRITPILVESQKSEYLNRFEPFRTFNISFNLQYPLNDKFIVSLEPFTRFSLGKMTQKDLQLNMTGLRLRFNFLP